jgi:RNA-binding protein YhbY
VELFRCRLHIEKVILNIPPSYESTLAGRDEVIKVWLQSQSQDFGDKLAKSMNQTDRSEVTHLGGLICFWKQNEEGRVEGIKRKIIKIIEFVDRRQQVVLDYVPRGSEETP